MKLETKTVEKVWGRRNLTPPFRSSGDAPIGEVWFEPPPALPQVLVKYLFTSEKLSVQVHPSDDQAPQGASGKEECWLVLDAEPGATLAIGFKRNVGRGEMRAAALDGSIEDLLEWHPVQAGDFFYLPAGTVHAIGPGLTLVEVQQNSDITFRLYDYGRPRELHLDQGIEVASGGQYPAEMRQTVAEDADRTLVDGPYFRFSQCIGAPDAPMSARHEGAVMVLPLDGPVIIGNDSIETGECGLAGSLADVDFFSATRTLIVSGA